LSFIQGAPLPPTASLLVITAEKLVKSYGAFRAVDELSLEVCRGEIFGFLGPNGAGKTTSIKMLCGLLAPDSGRIALHGGATTASIGVCPQNIVTWENLTCIEQLTFMGAMYGMRPSQARRKSYELLEAFGLTAAAGKLAKTLSGGMQRRCNIALALVHGPDLVILDEPQAGLDPQSRVLVREYILSLKKSATVILTTHDMEEAEKLSDRICIIDHGRVLCTGTVDAIKKSIGRGDMFEIEIEGDIQTDLLPHLTNSINGLSHGAPNLLAFTAENATRTISDIMHVITTRAITLRSFRMRSTSLEDVFIHLTGRRLRE
jgi:ABC-2 type transport system ATP-binding protein